jgi:hypothetical protein
VWHTFVQQWEWLVFSFSCLNEQQKMGLLPHYRLPLDVDTAVTSTKTQDIHLVKQIDWISEHPDWQKLIGLSASTNTEAYR